MNLSILVLVLCYLAMICTLIFLPLNTKKILNKSGKLIYSLSKKNNIGFYAVCVFAFALVFLLRLKTVNFYSIVINLCAVLGLFIVTKEANLKKVYGVYENMIIVNSSIIEYSDIVTFPILDLPKDEQEHYPKNILVLATESKGKTELVFETDEICQKVIECLKELKVIKD